MPSKKRKTVMVRITEKHRKELKLEAIKKGRTLSKYLEEIIQNRS